MILTELCGHLKNWFVRSDNDIHTGEFEVVGGSVEAPWLVDGQYFRIIGSVFNDGVWRYPVTDLVDETFEGAIWAMSIPPDVIALADDIAEWQGKYADVTVSPYTSESFGGYTYTKSGGASVTGTTGVLSWQTIFRSRLNRYRKI